MLSPPELLVFDRLDICGEIVLIKYKDIDPVGTPPDKSLSLLTIPIIPEVAGL